MVWIRGGIEEREESPSVNITFQRWERWNLASGALGGVYSLWKAEIPDHSQKVNVKGVERLFQGELRAVDST
jgi:hypothetical protein